MRHDPFALDTALNAALGHDAALVAELRHALTASANGHLRSLERAESLAGWRDAAHRLHGLAASFGAEDLLRAAAAAAVATEPDPAILAVLRHEVAALG